MIKNKISLIGAGYWGKNLLRNFYELGNLKNVVELDPEIIALRKKDYPDVEFIDDIDKVINDNEIKGVAIATPAATHYELSKKFLLAGKDVFVEKPLALRVDEGKKLVEIAEAEKRILMVGHILQYHPAVIKLKELINNGELGKINYIYSNRLNMGKLRSEENVLWSFAPHDISVILGLMNDFPVEINTVKSDFLQKNIADTVVVNFTFKSGTKGHIFVSWLHPFKEQLLVVVGDKKMAVFDDTTDNKLVLYPHQVEWKNHLPVAVKSEAEVVELERGEPLKNECLAFLNAVETRKQPVTDGIEGLNVLRFLSIAEGGGTEDNNVYFAHPTAVIEDGADIGEGTKIWHYTHVMKGAKIGKRCNIGQNVYVDKKAVIGNGVKIQNNVSVYDDVILEDEVFCGPSMVFTNVINPRSHIERKDEYKRTLVKRRATIGANATIVCGNTIGAGAFIGAGAVVTRDVPDYALVVGNPARVVGWMCECGIKLRFDGDKAKCSNCGAEYVKKGDNIVKI